MTNYIIIDQSEVANVDFSKVKETSADTLRYSIDGTKTFVKFEGDVPAFLDGKQQYTHAQILEVLAGEGWTSGEPQ
jgi:hypothetical protein